MAATLMTSALLCRHLMVHWVVSAIKSFLTFGRFCKYLWFLWSKLNDHECLIFSIEKLSKLIRLKWMEKLSIHFGGSWPLSKYLHEGRLNPWRCAEELLCKSTHPRCCCCDNTRPHGNCNVHGFPAAYSCIVGCRARSTECSCQL